MEDTVNSYFDRLKQCLDSLSREEIISLAEILEMTRKNQKNVFIFGNGGSAATASHFAGDLNKGVSYKKMLRHRVIALTDNYPVIMAYANDVSYDDIFVEQLKNFIDDGDVVIGISGSGNSKNVIKAIEYANTRGNTTVGITGYDGGTLKRIANYSVNANIDDMQIAEDIHMVLAHVLMKILMQAEELPLAGNNNA